MYIHSLMLLRVSVAKFGKQKRTFSGKKSVSQSQVRQTIGMVICLCVTYSSKVMLAGGNPVTVYPGRAGRGNYCYNCHPQELEQERKKHPLQGIIKAIGQT